jgi:DNA polymerase I-like protein with 3'-5' exonuclease and polymerase domains
MLWTGFDPVLLQSHEAWIRERIADIECRAREMVGSDINLGSAAQLAVALYQTLKLPPPGGRNARCEPSAL